MVNAKNLPPGDEYKSDTFPLDISPFLPSR